MKKTLRMLVCAVLVFSMLAMAACGSKKSSMEDYVKTDAVQKELEAAKSQFESQGFGVDITGEGNKLIYSYSYGEMTGAEAIEAGLADALESELAKQSSAFTGLASELKKAVDVDNPVVVVRYLGSDGEEIYSEEFAAE